MSLALALVIASRSLVNAQATTVQATAKITTPPRECSEQCKTFSLDSCKQSIVPSNQNQWSTTCQSLSSCICPILDKNMDCQNCLVSNTAIVGASTYWTNLHSFCTQDTAAVQICQLFGIVINVNIAGAVNVSTTVPPLSSIPETTPTPKSQAFVNVPVPIISALAVALLISVVF